MDVKLEQYNRKRDFSKTSEPEGESAETNEELAFVVQHHMARRDHYDLRLEWDGVLFSWAVPKGPSYNTIDKRLAVQVEEHPLEYRNFEGTIPKGEYGGGIVMLWDEGSWEPLVNVDEGLREGSLKFVLNGRRLKGKWALVRMKPEAGETKDNWLLLKERDEYARSEDGIAEFSTSIRTGRTMEQIEAGENEKLARNPFSQADIQLAKLVNTPPQGEDWLFELKYDGYRILAYIEGNHVRLITRNGNNYTERFKEIASSLLDWAKGRAMVLDGEMVITDEAGKTDFHALQSHMRNPQRSSLSYIIFDLLALEGKDLREHGLIERKGMLEALMEDAPQCLHYSRHVKGQGQESLLAACRMDMEGIVGKRADSPYSGTRNGDWIKIKCRKRQEFVIGGYTLSDKRLKGISSLLLGAYRGGELLYIGRVGTGFGAADMKELLAKFVALTRAESPFTLAPKPKGNERITWLEPKLVAEVEFAQWTKDDLLRQPSFKGLRVDKDPLEVKLEIAEDEPEAPTEEMETKMETEGNKLVIEGVKITSPNKVIFTEPKITKEDVIRYYAQVSQHMLPYVSYRILSIVRCPKGASQSCFYKKHPGPKMKGVMTIPVKNSDGEVEEYFYIENASGLVSEAQMGTLEFHTWGSRVQELEQPDMMVFDLDPDEEMELEQVRQGVRDVKSILEKLSLVSYLKTSGGKGYHVVVPLKPVASWDIFHDFAKRIAEVMEQQWPERYTSNVRKAKRTNKIFIDWIRNARGATSIAPYSIRAREGARVSMPIAWDELDTVTPNGIDMAEALNRVCKDDPWKDFFLQDQSLK